MSRNRKRQPRLRDAPPIRSHVVPQWYRSRTKYILAAIVDLDGVNHGIASADNGSRRVPPRIIFGGRVQIDRCPSIPEANVGPHVAGGAAPVMYLHD